MDSSFDASHRLACPAMARGYGHPAADSRLLYAFNISSTQQLAPSIHPRGISLCRSPRPRRRFGPPGEVSPLLACPPKSPLSCPHTGPSPSATSQ